LKDAPDPAFSVLKDISLTPLSVDVLYARESLEDFPFFQLFPVYWAPDILKIRKKWPEECANPLFVSKDSLFQVVRAKKSSIYAASRGCL
jgi:hypothetical protein